MDINEKIKKLKKDRKAVILVHNYQRPEVQDVADFIGDSLGLSRQAAATPAEVIVFCGVNFMAETAKILSPKKTVLVPDSAAVCPMADMIDVPKLLAEKKKHPGAKVVAYVNTSAAIKAEADLCCTSANAVEMVNANFGPDEELIFVPDQYLGDYTNKQTGRKMVLWPGYCPTHLKITPEEIRIQKQLHPGIKVISHPECTKAVLDESDAALSTEGMIRYVKESTAREFLIGTEVGIIYRLQKEFPDRKFYPAEAKAVCPNMKRTTLEKVLWSLEEMKHEVIVPEETAKRARASLEKGFIKK